MDFLIYAIDSSDRARLQESRDEFVLQITSNSNFVEEMPRSMLCIFLLTKCNVFNESDDQRVTIEDVEKTFQLDGGFPWLWDIREVSSTTKQGIFEFMDLLIEYHLYL